jgi:DNA helicase-2/ATP-dependent DNA helicase PcrA
VANIKDDDEKLFKESTFKKLLQEKSTLDEKVVKFEKNIYLWSINVMRGNHKHVLGEIQAYIISIFSEFFSQYTPCNNFLYDNYVINDISVATEIEDCNLIFNTVHGVKGQTHLATLYLESFYNSEYESTQMSEVFSGLSSLELISTVENEITQLKGEIIELNILGKPGSKTREKKIITLNNRIDNIKKYSKMLYVGFSRPTHLLAFAVEENRFNELAINEDVWDVAYI